MNHAAPALVLAEGQRLTLETLAKSKSAPHRDVLRARALLLAAEGVANTRTAAQIGVSAMTVRAWRERHPQVQFHFTPTYSSWLNQVEIWFGMISRDCIRRGIFRSVADLVSKILSYVRLYNRNAQPFRWTYRNPRKRIRVSPISETRH